MCKKSFGKVIKIIKSLLEKLCSLQKVHWKNCKNNKKSLGKIVFFIKSHLENKLVCFSGIDVTTAVETRQI